MDEVEFLVSYGSSGEFSRFRPDSAASYHRGDRVVVRSYQGLEMGVVLCRATPGHAPFLSRTAAGDLLRAATPEDERAAAEARRLGTRVADDARQLAAGLGLPLEVLDVEVLLDGRQAIIHHLRQAECDYRPLVSTLSHSHDLLITMQNLAEPAVEAGCGKPGCGGGGGGCSSCGSGCSSGGCGKGVKKDDVTAYLAGLREQMETRARTPLL
jgi:cell fate regulator YaaT (PSP1 superfamily)